MNIFQQNPLYIGPCNRLFVTTGTIGGEGVRLALLTFAQRASKCYH